MPPKWKTNLVKDILVESLSEDHFNVLARLEKPKYDEDVAAELKVKATIVRTILNELHQSSLVEYQRTKNKRTGWYTYLWNRREDKISEFITNYLKKRLEELNKELDAETQNLTFQCSCERVPYEIAMEASFLCDKCTQPYLEVDNSEYVDELVSEIARLNSLLQQT
jgi:transcription factor E